jgi:hypothetical protein
MYTGVCIYLGALEGGNRIGGRYIMMRYTLQQPSLFRLLHHAPMPIHTPTFSPSIPTHTRPHAPAAPPHITTAQTASPHPSIYPSIHPSIHPPTHPSIHPSIHPSTVHQSIHPPPHTHTPTHQRLPPRRRCCPTTAWARPPRLPSPRPAGRRRLALCLGWVWVGKGVGWGGVGRGLCVCGWGGGIIGREGRRQSRPFDGSIPSARAASIARDGPVCSSPRAGGGRQGKGKATVSS